MNRAPRLAALGLLVLLAGRSADGGDPPARSADLNHLIRLIAGSDDPDLRRDLLAGTLEAVAGRRRMPMPSAWAESYRKLQASPDPDVRFDATRLGIVFGDPAAFASVRAIASDRKSPTPLRIEAIATLAGSRDERLSPVLQSLLADPAVRAASIRGLAAADDAETPALILKAYPSLNPAEKADAVGTLSVRPASAIALLDAIDAGSIPRVDVPAASLQALTAHTDARVKSAVAKVWGTIRPTPSEKRGTIERLKAELNADALAKADRSRGRLVFAKACASCHQLFDAGGKIGPELTGSQRTSLDYVLSNVVDPSAVVGRDYQVSVFSTSDGRVVSGVVRREDEASVLVQTATDLVPIPKPEIESRRATADSMMPEGLLNPLSKDEIRDLVAYLASPSQVPLPPAADVKAVR